MDSQCGVNQICDRGFCEDDQEIATEHCDPAWRNFDRVYGYTCGVCETGYAGDLCRVPCSQKPPGCADDAVVSCADPRNPTSCSSCNGTTYGETCGISCRVRGRPNCLGLSECSKLGALLQCLSCAPGYTGPICDNLIVCGNGIVEGDEECDGSAICSSNCTIDRSPTSVGTICSGNENATSINCAGTTDSDGAVVASIPFLGDNSTNIIMSALVPNSRGVVLKTQLPPNLVGVGENVDVMLGRNESSIAPAAQLKLSKFGNRSIELFFSMEATSPTDFSRPVIQEFFLPPPCANGTMLYRFDEDLDDWEEVQKSCPSIFQLVENSQSSDSDPCRVVFSQCSFSDFALVAAEVEPSNSGDGGDGGDGDDGGDGGDDGNGNGTGSSSSEDSFFSTGGGITVIILLIIVAIVGGYTSYGWYMQQKARSTQQSFHSSTSDTTGPTDVELR